jgi:hypothetical protein
MGQTKTPFAVKSLNASLHPSKRKDRETVISTNRTLKDEHTSVMVKSGTITHNNKSVGIRKDKAKTLSKSILFMPRFETYYYRDLLWKVNFSNEMVVEPPLEYEHRLRVFVGKGNNASLIRGLLKRRIWLAITDRIEDANFVWTQIKHLPYFDMQTCQNHQNNCDDKDQEKRVKNYEGIQ